ncbi:hypothetical protein BWQ93_05870 [Sphingopyxis sp. QXT-31]|uniref:hypothetical protein n=1 Tax=Sphingopyxis sp. QXT-31 TaxID=1357916 RepID=UPI0009798407|nr:hypothetical protein [Sphingopyxis sp. QXT-31]APZ98059.1 hypothetical protein BWQ93_05870 [Sphingopyxis sp. QXT-31]
MMLTVLQVHEAATLIHDRERLTIALAQPGAGLRGVGPFSDAWLVEAIAPVYRATLVARLGEIDTKLRALGVDPASAPDVDQSPWDAMTRPHVDAS